MLSSLSTSDIIQIIILTISLVYLIIIIINYYYQIRSRISIAFRILMLLFLNLTIMVIASMIPLFIDNNYTVCKVSVILQTGFNLAANIWICFISRIVFRQLKQPGKYINFGYYMLKHILITYIPSIIVMILLGIFFDQMSKQFDNGCWKTITHQYSLLNAVMQILTIILPIIVTLIINIVYLIAYFKSKYQKFNIFLCFSILQITLSIYFLSTKIYYIISSQILYVQSYQIYYICEPLIYCILYTVLAWKNVESNRSDSYVESLDGSGYRSTSQFT